MTEIHEWICWIHVGGRTLMLIVVRVIFFWPTLRNNCMKYTRRCDQCQKHVEWRYPRGPTLHQRHTWGSDNWDLSCKQLNKLNSRRSCGMVHQLDRSRTSNFQSLRFHLKNYYLKVWAAQVLDIRLWYPI